MGFTGRGSVPPPRLGHALPDLEADPWFRCRRRRAISARRINPRRQHQQHGNRIGYGFRRRWRSATFDRIRARLSQSFSRSPAPHSRQPRRNHRLDRRQGAEVALLRRQNLIIDPAVAACDLCADELTFQSPSGRAEKHTRKQFHDGGGNAPTRRHVPHPYWF